MTSGGLSDENLGTSVQNDDDNDTTEVLDSMVNGELTIPIVTAYLVEEGPGEEEVIPVGKIPRYILHTVGKKDGPNMDNTKEYEEEGGIYEQGSDMDGEECNDGGIARKELMVEKAIKIWEEMVLDNWRKMLDWYTID